MTINQNVTFSGTSGSLYIGRHPAGSLSRVLMRFPNLSLSGISPTQITAASVELRDLMCQGDEDITVECRFYNNSAPSWSESGTTTWSSVGTSYLGSSLLDSHVISYGEGNVDGEQHRYSFNILVAAKAWANGTQSPSKGLVFKAADSFENQTGDDVKTWYKTFASYNRSNYKPSLSLTYDIYSGGEGFADAETLTLNSPRYVNITTTDTKKYFKFSPSTTGFYTFESSDIVSGDPRAWLYNSDYTVLSSNDDGAGSSNFRLTYHLVAGYTYYFVAGCIVSSPTICTVKVTTTTVPSSISTTSLSWGDSRVASCNAKNKAVFYKFIPSQSGEYMFFSTASSGDPKIWLYNSSLSLVSSNDDDAGNYNFRLSASLVSGQTYYIVAGECGAKIGSYYHHLSKATNMSTSVNYLRNVGTLKYMDIDGPDAQEWVHQWSAHTDLQEKWTLQRQSDGYFTIRSQYDKKYYVGISSTSTGVNNIKLYSGVADNTKWKIYELSSGVFLLEPKTAPGKILYAPSTGTCAKLQLSNLSASVSERNRWNVLKNALSYVNYYDSSFGSNSILQSYVTKANEFSDFVFTKYFGVGMYIDGSPSQYATVLDDCSTGTNTCCTTATCGSKCNYGHHKNIFTISNQLYNDDREDNHLYVLWTNREYGKAYCCEQNGRHTSYTAIALVCNKWPVIHFLNIYGSNNSRQLACMAMNIVHETAHTMGMPDVYNNIGHDVSGTKCLMEKFDETTAYAFYQDVLNGIEDPFCPSCMQTMETYTSNVYLPGN